VTSLFFLNLSQKLVYLLRGIDPHEPAKQTAPLPSNSALRRIREPVHAESADPHVSLRLHARGPGDVAPDVHLG